MRERPWWRVEVLWVLLSVVFAVTLLAATPAMADIPAVEVREYSRDFDVSRSQAEAHLEVQDQAAEAEIVDGLEQRLDGRYAGVWFDNATGEFVVPTLSPATQATVAAEFTDAGIGGDDYRSIPARFSWANLTTVQENVDRTLVPLLEEGIVQTWLDPRTNAVVIELASAAGKSERAKIQEIVGTEGAAVEVRESAERVFGARPAGCVEQNYHLCGKPLRGGVRLEPSGASCCISQAFCTVGFKAIGNTYGNRFVLTAGHCARFVADFASYDSDQGNQSGYVGHLEASFFPGHDYAAINANNLYWDTPSWPSKVAFWGTDLERSINNESSSYLGEQVCHSGATTGSSCGSVTTLNKTAHYGNDLVYNLTGAQGFCTYFGDSGGPIFTGNTAVGILSGFNASDSESDEEIWAKRCSYETYYSEVTEVTEALGVHVATSVGSFPFAQTGDASSIQMNQATGGGTVDPNGLSTDYHFEYGKTTAYGSSTQSWNAGSGWSPGPVSGTISGLQGRTTYHYRIVATNSAGSSTGEDRQFTTPSLAPIAGEDDNFASPHAVGQVNGTIDIFFRTPSGGLGHDWFQSGGGGWSSGSLPGNLASVPHAVTQENGTADVFYRTPSGELGHAWDDSNGWHSSNLPGSLASNPHPVAQPDGTIDVLYRTPNGELGHNWYEPGGEWHHSTLAGSVASDPYLVAQPNGTVDAFYRTQSGELGHAWTQGGTWSVLGVPGTSLGASSVPHPVVQDSGTVDVFWRTPSGELGHAWDDSNGWHSSNLSGSLASDPHAVSQPNGTIDVFYRTPSGGLGHNWFSPCCGGWSSNTLSGSVAGDPYPVVQDNGMIDVFYRTPSGGLGHNWTSSGGWSSGSLPGSVATVPHAVALHSGVVDVFFRTPSGEIGHDWFMPGSGWFAGSVPGSVAPEVPQANTEAATSVKATSATLTGSVDPQGLETSYQFEYGKTTSYGSKVPGSAKSIGSGIVSVGVSEPISGLESGTTYHYRVVATSGSSTVNGEDKTFTTEAPDATSQLTAMAVTDPFNATTSAISNFGSNWTALGWASGTPAKGEDRSTGWGPSAAFPTVNGASYGPAVTDTGPGSAVVTTMAANPVNAERYFSLWLDMSSPAGAKAGYELRFTDVATNTYNVTLSKWTAGAQTVLASKSNYSFANGNSLALADQGGVVTAWTNTGSGFSKILNANDASFSGGNTGVEGAGNFTRLTNFKVGLLLSSVANMDAALKALPVTDGFATNESPLSGGGAWAALNWNTVSPYETGQVSGGWGPYAAYFAVNGAYWQKASFADTGAGGAVSALLYTNPMNSKRYFSLWLDMPSPATAKSGYELRFTETSSSVYEVVLSKWQAGTKTALASKTGYAFPTNSLFGLVDKAGVVSAWTKTGSEYAQLLSAADSTFTSGYAGIEGSGNGTRIKEFKSGPLAPF